MLSFAGAGCAGGGGVIMNRPSPARVRVSGPLQAYAAGFREELSTLGYSARSAAGHLQLMAHLSRWLVEIGSAPGELTLPRVERFVQGSAGRQPGSSESDAARDAAVAGASAPDRGGCGG